MLKKNIKSGKSISALMSDDYALGLKKESNNVATGYTAVLNLVTEDAVNIDLCMTSGAMSWLDQGTGVYLQAASPVFWSGNPTTAGTHWYVDSTAATVSVPVGSTASSITGYAAGAYHNTDFPLTPPGYMTWSSHDLQLTIYPMLPSGQVATYTEDFTNGGFYSEVIHTVFTGTLY